MKTGKISFRTPRQEIEAPCPSRETRPSFLSTHTVAFLNPASRHNSFPTLPLKLFADKYSNYDIWYGVSPEELSLPQRPSHVPHAWTTSLPTHPLGRGPLIRGTDTGTGGAGAGTGAGGGRRALSVSTRHRPLLLLPHLLPACGRPAGPGRHRHRGPRPRQPSLPFSFAPTPAPALCTAGAGRDSGNSMRAAARGGRSGGGLGRGLGRGSGGQRHRGRRRRDGVRAAAAAGAGGLCQRGTGGALVFAHDLHLLELRDAALMIEEARGGAERAPVRANALLALEERVGGAEEAVQRQRVEQRVAGDLQQREGQQQRGDGDGGRRIEQGHRLCRKQSGA